MGKNDVTEKKRGKNHVTEEKTTSQKEKDAGKITSQKEKKAGKITSLPVTLLPVGAASGHVTDVNSGRSSSLLHK